MIVAVRSDYISEEVNPDNENDNESIFVKISLQNNKSLIVGSVYRPPYRDLTYLKKQVDKLNKMLKIKDLSSTYQTSNGHHIL